jgi:hypothetical protein
MAVSAINLGETNPNTVDSRTLCNISIYYQPSIQERPIRYSCIHLLPITVKNDNINNQSSGKFERLSNSLTMLYM